jgi:hypothetical protein
MKNDGKQWAIVVGAAIGLAMVTSLFPRAGGWLLLIVVLTMVLVAGRRGLWDAPGSFTF